MNLWEYAAQQKKASERSTEATAGIVNNRTNETPGKPPQLSSSYRRIYRDVFEFHAKHADKEPTQAEWEKIVADVGAAASNANNDPFALDLLAAVMAELERKFYSK